MTRPKTVIDRPGTPVAKGKTTGSKRFAEGMQAAPKRTPVAPGNGGNAGQTPERPSRLRLKLKTIDDVQAELARLYRSGKAGEREVADVSKLANILGILGRLIVENDVAARIEALEEQARGAKSA